MMAADKVEHPARGSGSGKRGAILKIDLLRALVQHHLPDWSEQQKEEICKGMCQERKQTEGVSQSVLEAVAQLDEENRKHFKEVKRDAKEKLAQLEKDKQIKEKLRDTPAPPAADKNDKPPARESPEPPAVPEPVEPAPEVPPAGPAMPAAPDPAMPADPASLPHAAGPMAVLPDAVAPSPARSRRDSV